RTPAGERGAPPAAPRARARPGGSTGRSCRSGGPFPRPLARGVPGGGVRRARPPGRRRHRAGGVPRGRRRARSLRPPAPPGALAAAAHAEHPRRAVDGRRGRALVLAPALALVLVAALTPPGGAGGEWVGRTVRNVVAPPPPEPAGLGALPGGGRLLVLADHGA